eukprot:20547-Prorocentrum_minimum.AAC.3
MSKVSDRQLGPSSREFNKMGGFVCRGKRVGAVDVKGYVVDVKGYVVDVKGYAVDVKGCAVAVTRLRGRERACFAWAASAPSGWRRSSGARTCTQEF